MICGKINGTAAREATRWALPHVHRPPGWPHSVAGHAGQGRPRLPALPGRTFTAATRFGLPAAMSASSPSAACSVKSTLQRSRWEQQHGQQGCMAA